MQKVIHNPMAAALIAAQRKASANGINTKRIGAQILTHEAKGTGVIWRQKTKTNPMPKHYFADVPF